MTTPNEQGSALDIAEQALQIGTLPFLNTGVAETYVQSTGGAPNLVNATWTNIPLTNSLFMDSGIWLYWTWAVLSATGTGGANGQFRLINGSTPLATAIATINQGNYATLTINSAIVIPTGGLRIGGVGDPLQIQGFLGGSAGMVFNVDASGFPQFVALKVA